MPKRYDPPVALEGADQGLIEAVAARMWAKRASLFSQRVTHCDFKQQSSQVITSWRRTAETVLEFLIHIGFEGPGGPPKRPAGEWSYAWVYECNDWEIHDADGNGVALVLNVPDVPMMMAAPKMATAIKALLDRLGDDPAAQMPEIVALRDALPKEPI